MGELLVGTGNTADDVDDPDEEGVGVGSIVVAGEGVGGTDSKDKGMADSSVTAGTGREVDAPVVDDALGARALSPFSEGRLWC